MKMNRITAYFTLGSLILNIGGVSVSDGAEPSPESRFLICARGMPVENVIAIPANPGMSVRYAADELRRCIGRMTGVELPVVEGYGICGGRGIRLVRTEEYGPDGFRIRVKDGAVEISGGKRGVLYGAYELLETYGGCGWYASWHEVIPRKDAFSVPADLDDTQKPAFVMRMVTWQDVREDSAFAAKLRINGHACRNSLDMDEKYGGLPISFVQELGNCHTFGKILPSKKYFAEHPDWFSKVKGVRRNGRTQICLTNPSAFEQAFSNICEYVDRDIARRKSAGSESVADMLVAGVSQNDWHNWCECDACKAIDDREGAHSGTLLHFINRMADRLSDRYPGLKTETLIYQYTRKAPKTMRPGSNVIPCLCSIECSFATPLAARDDRLNAAFMDDLESWGRLSDNLYVWDYTMRPHHYYHPLPNVHVFAPNLRTFRDNGVKYMFVQGGPRYGDLSQLKGWLLAKLLWNPDQPLEPLLDRFFRGHYGAAAPYMREYLDRVENSVTGRKKVRFTIWEKDRRDIFPDDFIEWSRGVFTKAKEVVKDDPLLSGNVRIASFTPVCMNLDRRASEAKWVWVTRNPSRYPTCADLKEDLDEAFALSAELCPKDKKLRFSESGVRNLRTWKDWSRMREYRIPKKGSDRAVVGVRDLNYTSWSFGKFLRSAEGYKGEVVEVFNVQCFYPALSLRFSNVAYDSDRKYRIRFRAKVAKAKNGKGEAFNAEFAGMRIAPKVEEVKDGWQWYGFEPVALKDSYEFSIKTGRFDKGGGHTAVDAVYFDRMEIKGE